MYLAIEQLKHADLIALAVASVLIALFWVFIYKCYK
jgi:hypothetical protein